MGGGISLKAPSLGFPNICTSPSATTASVRTRPGIIERRGARRTGGALRDS